MILWDRVCALASEPFVLRVFDSIMRIAAQTLGRAPMAHGSLGAAVLERYYDKLPSTFVRDHGMHVPKLLEAP
jgi:hypothetical protein